MRRLLAAIAILIATPLAAQTGWVGELRGRDSAIADAVVAVDAALAARPTRSAERYDAVLRAYAAASDESGTAPAAVGDGPAPPRLAAAYAEAGVATAEEAARRAVAAGTDEGAAELSAAGLGWGAESAARARLVGLAPSLPPVGTLAFRDAERWLASLARAEGVDADAVARLTSTLETTLASTQSERELSEAADALEAILAGAGGGTASDGAAGPQPAERLGELFALWRASYFAGLPEQRLRLLEAMRRVVRSQPFAALGESGALADELGELAVATEWRVEFQELLPVTSELLALVSAASFADPAGLAGAPGALRLRRIYESIGSARASAATAYYTAVPEVRFLIDLSASLLASSSPLQRFRVTEALGVDDPSWGGRLSRRLNEFVAAARGHALPDGREPDAARRAPTAVFTNFIGEGESYVDALGPWSRGERLRSGDEFRWAMLPILSHPYAQFLLVSDPRRAADLAMVAGFATEIYDEALRRAGLAGGSVRPLSAGTASLPFARVYEVQREEQIDMLYAAFVATAQGVASLTDDFDAPYTAGLTVAGYWSHLHGFHLVRADADAPDARIRGRADAWFALARAADTAEEELSLTLRGLVALGDAIDEELSLDRAPASAHLAPRLTRARALLEEAALFRMEPSAVVDLLSELYETSDIDAVTDGVAADVTAHRAWLTLAAQPGRSLLVAEAAEEAGR